MKRALLTAALALLAHPLLAADGVLIVEKTTTGDVTRTNQIQIEQTRMRAESTDAAGAQRVMIFDGTAQIIRMIDVAKKTYTEMTKADAERMGGQMSGMMAKMQEQMKSMPPEQRATMEAMMKGRGMPGMAPAAKVEFRRAGTDKVGKWACDRYDRYQNNQKTQELCTVDPKALGLTPADFEVTKQVAEFFAQLMPQNADELFSVGDSGAQGYSGVPIRRASVGARPTISEVTEISRQTFPDAGYAVPQGFQKQTFGMPGR